MPVLDLVQAEEIDTAAKLAAIMPHRVTFTVEVTGEVGGTPLVTVAPPTSDYVGDDDSDLVSYPDPAYDEWGRPIA